MAEKTRGVQNQAIRKKSLTLKRRFQRTMSLSVLSSHLSVKVYDSHADTSNKGLRRNRQRNKLERKTYSLQEMIGIDQIESNCQQTLVGERKSRYDTSPTTTVLSTSYNSISYTEHNSSNNSSFLKRASNHSRLDSANDSLRNTIKTYVSDTRITDAPREITSAGYPQDYLSREGISSRNHKGSVSPMDTGHFMPARQKKWQKYAVSDCLADIKAECILDIVKVYSKHCKEAKRREKLINDIQLQAKVRASSKNRALNSYGLSCKSQRPRRLSPLREKPRLPEGNEAIKDNRFQNLIQSLTKLNIH